MGKKLGMSINKGDVIKCKCGKTHKWLGYETGDNRGGTDEKGWYLMFDAAHIIQQRDGFYVRYQALCPDCR